MFYRFILKLSCQQPNAENYKLQKKTLQDISHNIISFSQGQFFPSGSFAFYNMFNNHFFQERGKKTLLEFLNSGEEDDIVLVMDPPFGGLVEVLAATVKKIWKYWRECTSVKGGFSITHWSYSSLIGCSSCSSVLDNKKEIPTIWIFPYFMESHIQESLPSLKMMDYKVCHENENSSLT